MKGFQSLYFIWETLGALLRTLSLSGTGGNVLAWFLYLLISLFPVLVLVVHTGNMHESFQCGLPGWWMWRKKSRMHGRDLLLPLLSAYTFYLLYVFINPSLLSRRMPTGLEMEGVLPYLKAIYGGLWLSLLLSWLMLTWIGRLNEEEILDRKRFLYQGMGLLLTASMVLVGAGLLYSTGTELYRKLTEISTNASAMECFPGTSVSRNTIGWDMAFAILWAARRLLPACFLLGIFYRIKGLLKAMEKEPFEEEEVFAAKRLADVSRNAVSASVLCDLIWNGALFFCAGKLTRVDYQWELSLFPLLVAFGALILARYLREAGELRRDNEMII